MNAIEFVSNVKNGVIKIPKKFKIKENISTKVILLFDNEDKRNTNLTDVLLNGPALSEEKNDQFKEIGKEFQKWQIKES